MTVNANLSIYKAQAVVLSFTRASGTDGITGWALNFLVKRQEGDAANVLSKTVGAGVTITDGAAGSFAVALSETDTDLAEGDYYYAVWRTDAGFETPLAWGFLSVDQIPTPA